MCAVCLFSTSSIMLYVASPICQLLGVLYDLCLMFSNSLLSCVIVVVHPNFLLINFYSCRTDYCLILTSEKTLSSAVCFFCKRLVQLNFPLCLFHLDKKEQSWCTTRGLTDENSRLTAHSLQTDMPPKSKNLISRMKLKTKPFIFLLAITFTGFLLTSHWLQLTHQSLCGCFSRDILPFIRRVEPFLSANNSISEDAFIWWTVSSHTFNKKRSVVWLFECWPNIQPMFHVSWQRLQDERRDFDYYKATVNKLFEIFPPNPTFGKWSTGRIRTCAVVGNSVNLKGSGYGRLIDMNDAIIR